MSAITSGIARRLSLLAGSSLLSAVVAGASSVVVLAPSAAWAANECGDPTTNGTTADTFQCVGTHAAITYPLTSGALTLQLQNNVTTTTGGLVVTGTGTDAVTVTRINDSPANSGDASLSSTSGTTAALEVTRATAGGTISVSLNDGSNDTGDTPLMISGVVGGVRLSNMGTSTTSFSFNNGTVSASAGVGVDLSTTGTGTLTLTNGSTTSGGGTVSGTTAGARLRTTGTGLSTVINNGTINATTGAALDLGTTGTGTITVTNGGLQVSNAISTISGPTAISVASGANVTVTNNLTGRLIGVLSLANSGANSITNGGSWTSAGSSSLGAGATTLSNTVSGSVTFTDSSTVDFGAGADTFTNAGIVNANGTVAFTGLETWDNSSAVILGDGQANDRLVHAGAFNASGTSRMTMDVDFSADQAGCSAAVTADCFDLRGGTTTGVTNIFVNPIAVGGAERIVLVDVAGAGSSAGGHFTLDGDVIDGGLFLYSLQYDATAEQHALVASDVSSGSLELALLGRAASEPWRTATGLWHDRQADLRTTLAGSAQGYAPGAWIKVAGGFVDESRFDTNGAGVGFNTSYAQETTALVGGIDLIRIIRENSAWVLGLTAGQVDSTADFGAGASVLDLEGQSFGAYASVLAGQAFFDAIINATDLDLTHAVIGQEFEGAAQSIGYQLEGGYRLFRINDDGAWFEPLAALTYVRSTVDDLDLGQVTASYADAASLRAAIGARIGGDLVTEALTASFSFTGRLWKEFEGQDASSIAGDLSDFDMSVKGVDNLGDLGVAVSLFGLGGRLSAHAAYNLLFQQDYQNTGASFGLRYNW